MDCPYCAEAVNPEASVCKTCRREISLVVSLRDANETLEERIKELEDELAALRPNSPVEAEAGPDAGPDAVEAEKPRPGIVDLIAIYLLLPMMLLIGAHYLLVIRLDAKLVWLRAASIVLPALVGLLLASKWRARWYVFLGLGIVVAAASVLGMSTMVHFTDGDPIFPKSAVDWRETLEYVTSISLAYLLGALMFAAVRPRQAKASSSARQTKLAAFLVKHVLGKKKGATVQEQIQHVVQLIRVCVSAATAVGAVYTGFKSIL